MAIGADPLLIDNRSPQQTITVRGVEIRRVTFCRWEGKVVKYKGVITPHLDTFNNVSDNPAKNYNRGVTADIKRAEELVMEVLTEEEKQKFEVISSWPIYSGIIVEWDKINV